MQKEKSQMLYCITLVLDNGKRKVVYTKAASQEAAERRALKRNPAAVDIHRS